MKIKIQRVVLPSLGRMGCLLGLVAAFLPSLLCGVLSVGLAAIVQHWLESWQDFDISLLGREVATIDFVRLLQLEGVLNVLRSVTGASGLALVLAILGLALASGLLLALITMLVGLAYNLLAAVTGGVVVEAQALQPRE
ncbi:MAG TPA: hypothetical protein VLC95_00090 [Anaerolineae bacterium]|nr:hypothetical protein [Anaerolineae bacterium]